MEASSWTLVVCILTSSQWSRVVGANCDQGWFGDRCQYKCRCQNDDCDLDGSCKSGVTCQGGWFGPECQYADIAYNHSSVAFPVVVDGNDSTCLNKVDTTLIKFELDKQFSTPWFRIRISKPELLSTMKIKVTSAEAVPLSDSDGGDYDDGGYDGGGYECFENTTEDRYTMDCYYYIDFSVNYIQISGQGVQYMCSLHVSGGRLVASTQNASQRSTFMLHYAGDNVYYSTANSVDGNKEARKTDSCSISEEGADDWNKSFTNQEIKGERIVLYFRDKEAGGEKTAHSFLNPYIREKEEYEHSLNLRDVQQRINQLMKYKDKEQANICEFDLYGESVCDPGWYGRDCEHRCNCAVTESCYVGTGGCFYGCALGFQENSTQSTTCDPVTKFQCQTGDDCIDKSWQCDGYTDCDDESDERNCTCFDNTYGEGCTTNCSQFCAKNLTNPQSCDSIFGTCVFGCVQGYKGLTCQETCSDNTYGKGCATNCSQFCAKNLTNPQSCDSINGTCAFGCVKDFKGLTCQEPDDNKSNLVAIWAVLPVTGGFLVVVLIYVYMRRRGKQEDKLRLTNLHDNIKVDSIQATPSNDSVKFTTKRQLPQQPKTTEQYVSDENEYATPADFELDSDSSDNQDEKLTEEDAYMEIEEVQRNSKDGSSEIYDDNDGYSLINNGTLSLAVNNQGKTTAILKEKKTTHGSHKADYVSLLDYKLDFASSDNQDEKLTVESESRRNSEAANSEIHDDTDCNSQTDNSTLSSAVNNQETITAILKEIKTTHGSNEADYVSLLDYELDSASSDNQDEKPTVERSYDEIM